MKIKQIGITILISIFILPIFIPIISVAYEEVQQEKGNIEDVVEKEEIEKTDKEETEEIEEDKLEIPKDEETKNEELETTEEDNKKQETEIPNEEELEETSKEEDETKETEEMEQEEIEIELNSMRATNSTSKLPEGDGIYTISTALNENKVLDVAGGSLDNCANIRLWDNRSVKQQKFELKYDMQTKTYTIKATHSNKVLDVENGASVNGTNVQQYASNNSIAQQWELKSAENGYFYIVSKVNGLYLDVTNGVAQTGTNIQVYEGNGSNAQKFKFTRDSDMETDRLPEGDGEYIISTALNKDKVLDVEGGSPNNGANIRLWRNANVKQQKFKLTYNATTKSYTMTATHSNKVLDVENGASENGTNVQQYDGNNSKAQQWILKNAGNGYFYIISKCNGLYLDVSNGIAENGSNIQIYQGNRSNAQKFKFAKDTDMETDKLPEGDGTYIISTALNEDKVLDVAGGATNNGANIRLWRSANVKQQKFKLTYNATTKTYTMTVTHSNKVLDVENGASANGTNVQQYDGNNSKAQQWILKNAGNGYFYIISKCNGLYLDVNNGIAENGSNIQVYEGNGSNAQKFKFTTIGIDDGLYTIKSALDNRYVLDVSGGSNANGANVQLYTDNGTVAQKWEVKHIGRGYYSILASHSGKALDVENGVGVNGANVQQYDSNNSIAQQWILKEAGNGYYYIVTRCNNLYLDVTYAVAQNGANIQIYEGNKSNAQKFKFEKTSKNNSSNYNSLEEGKYPGYKAMLQKLQKQYPNWSFEIYYTGLDWNVAVNQQDLLAGINDPRSLVHEYYYLHDSGGAEWINGLTKYDTSGQWYRASKKGIAYMMDPRNSLEEAWIFQFQDLTDSSATKEEIIKMLSKVTFLKNKETVADTIVKQCAKKGVNPFHIVARMVQEQGYDGGDSNGFKCTHAHKNTVYNLFNIRVNGPSGLTIGANYACDKGWLTQEKCIEDSIDFIKDEYIGVGQSTLYFQKYNVVNKIYSHQYMTNIYGANDEGNKMYQGYSANNLLNRQFKFVIPVYENMPSTPSPRPGK